MRHTPRLTATMLRRSWRWLSASSTAVGTIDSSTFESDVLHSAQGVCLVFTSPSMPQCEAHVDALARAVGKLYDTEESAPRRVKICQVNGDRQTNLASALSVSRASLPVTLFVYQASIVDRINGAICDKDRVEGIVKRFDEYVETHPIGAAVGDGEDMALSFPSLEPAALEAGSPLTSVALVKSLISALIGPNAITFPKSIGEAEGLKRTLQAAKKTSYEALGGLQRSLGLETKRLSDTAMRASFYDTEVYRQAALASSLEVLFLARVSAGTGQVPESHVREAFAALQRDFPPATVFLGSGPSKEGGDDVIAKSIVGGFRLAHALVPFVLHRGRLDAILRQHAQNVATMKSDGVEVAPSMNDAQFSMDVRRWMDLIDGPSQAATFPVDAMEDILKRIKDVKIAGGSALPSKASAKSSWTLSASEKMEILKACATCLIETFPTDDHVPAARAKLASSLY